MAPFVISSRTSLQESLNDLLLSFLPGQTQRAELHYLVAGDLSDCRFMDKRGVYVCGVQSRLSVHLPLSARIASQAECPVQRAFPSITE